MEIPFSPGEDFKNGEQIVTAFNHIINVLPEER